jgi:hypothetical protein
MPLYIALTYTPDVDWTNPPPEFAGEMEEYNAFGEAAAAVIRGGKPSTRPPPRPLCAPRAARVAT